MRRIKVSLSVGVHWRAPGSRSGVKVSIAKKYLPMSVMQGMYNLPMQIRIQWGGPHAVDKPRLQVVWGVPEADGWLQPSPFPWRAGGVPKQMRFNVSKKSLKLHTGYDTIPTGLYVGTLSCEPDEQHPMRMVISAEPRTYVAAVRAVPAKAAAPKAGDPFPEIDFP